MTTDEQINRAIHVKIMGNTPREISVAGTGEVILTQSIIPDYTTDLNAVALAEAKVIKKVGRTRLVASVLDVVVKGKNEQYPWPQAAWELTWTATARQRSLAVLKAMEIEL